MDKQILIDSLEPFILEQKCNELAKSTLKQYRATILRFIDTLPDDDLITKETMMNFKADLLEKEFQQSTVNSYLTIVNKYMHWLKHDELILKQLKIQFENSLEDVINDTDYMRLLRWAKKSGQFDTLLIMKIFANTGIRVSELKFFTVENLNFYIKITNKGKTRTIPVRQELFRDIKHYCKENKIKQGFILRGFKKGKMLNSSTIWKRIQKIAALAKVNKSKAHPHSFRHYFAKSFLEAGGNPLELADILGHGSLETTRIYNRSTDAEKRQRIERMKYLGGKG